MKTFFTLLLLSILLTGCTTIYTGDFQPVAPGVVNPEGVVKATPGQTYYNKSNSTLWHKVSGGDSHGWIQIL